MAVIRFCAVVIMLGSAASSYAATTHGPWDEFRSPLSAPDQTGTDTSHFPSALCRMAAAQAEKIFNIPDQLLDAISRVETGRYDQSSGTVRAWPWTINAQGVGHYYQTKDEAIEAARRFQAQGIQSIDVGCLQINLAYHPTAFSSLELAFDPQTNARYAADMLRNLFYQTGSWPHAAAAYHSQTPDIGTDYQRRVLEAWAEPIDGRYTGGHRPRHAEEDGGGEPPVASSIGPTNTAAATRPFGSAAPIIHARPPLFAGVMGRTLSAYRIYPVQKAALPPRYSAER